MALKKLDEAPSDSDQDKSAKQHRQSSRTPWAPAGCIGRYELWITLPRMRWRDDVAGFNGGVGHFRLLRLVTERMAKENVRAAHLRRGLRRAENFKLQAPEWPAKTAIHRALQERGTSLRPSLSVIGALNWRD
jgi:hypothetical protein